MQLTVIGSSDAFNSAGRAHSCYWLSGAGAGELMVDFGATALHALKRHGKDPRTLAGIAITHLHGDHVGGFPFLFIDGMFNQIRDSPLAILGPSGTTEKLETIYRVAYGDLADRPPPYGVTVRELLPGGEAELVGARVRGFAADHMDPPSQPLCLRISGAGGRTVAFSGDTAMCEGLFAAAAGADLLVAECTSMRQPAGRHCTWEEWLPAFPKIGARRILLTHLNDEVRARKDELRALAPPGVSVDFAEDGLVLEV